MNFSELATETLRQRIREEGLRRRDSLLGRRLEQAKSQQEQIEELTVRLNESEADRAARLEAINELTARLAESEADRAARFAQIKELTGLCRKSEEERAKQVGELTSRLEESEADRAARLDVIHNLEERIAGLRADLEKERQHLDAEKRRAEDLMEGWRDLERTLMVRLTRRIGLVKTRRIHPL